MKLKCTSVSNAPAKQIVECLIMLAFYKLHFVNCFVCGQLHLGRDWKMCLNIRESAARVLIVM